ncbi:dienelactone hydrolase family protein [Celeribacter litoreus]|uniref:dienelactone hydrolase family protein n=1 Tax=Celeribacter litoreus TaxID=2876714 RepID=UPI001CCD5030|nr:dienelactone hydrolase family protein [Celeribacter litoreus]MCA0043055.1 dienelactone hydrolase family protein [Celeribacter litoreus]
MTIERLEITYNGSDACQGGPFVGALFWDSAIAGPRPGVLVAPAFRGRAAFEEESARKIAEMGYVGFAIDYYGQGWTTTDADEAHAAKGKLDANRAALAARMVAALETLKAQDPVDPARTAAIGYCFGGKAVLDLAREGADIGGVASFHGILDRAESAPDVAIKSQVLVLHGWDDPLATPQSVVEFGQEMTERGAGWQLHAYGNTGHAFTNPAVKPGGQPGFGYSESSATRSWRSMCEFLKEVFA